MPSPPIASLLAQQDLVLHQQQWSLQVCRLLRFQIWNG
jgi:hypothetical protein